MQVLDFTIWHYLHSKLTNWTSEGCIQGNVTSKTHQLKTSACERSFFNSFFKKGSPTKPYATIPKGIMGNGVHGP